MTFLRYIAESEVFTVSGMNAIDSAKQSKLYDVLVYASEKKDMDELVNSYYEHLK